MKTFQRAPAIITTCALLFAPTIGFSLESRYVDLYEDTSEICELGDREDCMDAVLPLLSKVRGETDGEQYDHEIGTYALSMLEYYLELQAPRLSICILFADALVEISKSATDTEQAQRIFDISVIVRNCGKIGFNANRLLASPN